MLKVILIFLHSAAPIFAWISDMEANGELFCQWFTRRSEIGSGRVVDWYKYDVVPQKTSIEIYKARL